MNENRSRQNHFEAKLEARNRARLEEAIRQKQLKAQKRISSLVSQNQVQEQAETSEQGRPKGTNIADFFPEGDVQVCYDFIDYMRRSRAHDYDFEDTNPAQHPGRMAGLLKLIGIHSPQQKARWSDEAWRIGILRSKDPKGMDQSYKDASVFLCSDGLLRTRYNKQEPFTLMQYGELPDASNYSVITGNYTRVLEYTGEWRNMGVRHQPSREARTLGDCWEEPVKAEVTKFQPRDIQQVLESIALG